MIERRDAALSVVRNIRDAWRQLSRWRWRWTRDRLPCLTVPPPGAILRDQTHIRRRSWRRPARFGEVWLRSGSDDCGEQVGSADGIRLCVDFLAFRDRDGNALSDSYGEDGQVDKLGVGDFSRRGLPAEDNPGGRDRQITCIGHDELGPDLLHVPSRLSDSVTDASCDRETEPREA